MEEMKIYPVLFKSGAEKKLMRRETEGKSAIGLWIWASKRTEEVFIDFEEGTVASSSIAMIGNPEKVEGLHTGKYMDGHIYNKKLEKELDEPNSLGLTLEDELMIADEELEESSQWYRKFFKRGEH